MGLEPISLTACDFESHVYTTPALCEQITARMAVRKV